MMLAKRRLVGLVVAPLAPTLMMMCGLNLATSVGRLIAEEAVIISYTAAFVLGIPIFLIWRRCGWTSWLAYLGGAFVMGSIAFPFFGLEFVLWRTHSLSAALHMAAKPGLYHAALAMGLLAMPIGLLFWLIVRPDRMSP